MSPGAAQIEKLREAGFDEATIAKWQESTRAKLVAGGFDSATIDDYFGVGAINTTGVASRVDAALAPENPESDAPRRPKGLLEAFDAGFQTSVSGLASRGRLPTLAIDDQNSIADAVAASIGQAIGDLPVSIPTFIAAVPAGAAAGGATVGAVAPTPVTVAAGAAIGGAVAGGTVSGALTEATRQSYINFLRENEGQSLSGRDFAAAVAGAVIQKNVLDRAAEGALTGAATGAASSAVRSLAPIAGPALREAVVTSAELTAAVAITAAIEGELPDTRTLAVAAASTLGFKAGDIVANRTSKEFRAARQRLEDHFIQTGEPVSKILDRVETEPQIAQRIIAGAVDGLPDPDIDARVNDRVKDLTPEGVKKTILSNIVPVEKPKKTIAQQIDDFRYRYVNELQKVVTAPRLAFENATGRKLSAEENPGELARLAYGSMAKAELAIKRGVFEEDGKTLIARGLETIIKDTGDPEGFLVYAVSRRVVEKAGQGLETGFDFDSARLAAADGDKNPAFVKALKEFQDWSNSSLDRLVKSGYLTKESRDSIVSQNQDFVPLSRAVLNRELGASTVGFTTARGLPVRRPVKEFTGGDQKVFNPFEVAVKNRYALEQLIDNNDAIRRIVDFNSTLDPDFQFLSRVVGEKLPVKLSDLDPEVRAFFEENGLDASDINGLTVFRHVQKRLKANEFVAFIDGEAQVFESADPDLGRTLQRFGTDELGIISKLAAIPSSALRLGTVNSPEFISRSLVRELLAPVLINRFPTIPVVDHIGGLVHLIEKKEKWVQWIQNGGANSALLDIDRRIFSSVLKTGSETYWDGIRKDTWNVVTTPYRLLSTAATLAENAARLGQFSRSVDAGVDPRVAALRSRDISLDFARRGASPTLRAYNLVTAWLSATINGQARFIEAFVDRPVSTTAKHVGLITVPALILWAANREEPWYQELPPWERALFLHFNVGTKDAPTIARVPMLPPSGQLFGYLPVALLEAFIGENPDTAPEIVGNVLKAFELPVQPVLLTAPLEISTNTSFYTDSPLVSQSLERLLPQARYTPNTTESAIALSKLVNTFSGGFIPERFTTPIAIEHLARSWSGALGINALRTVDAGLRAAGLLPDRTKPDPKFADLPVVGGFFTRYPGASRSIDQFYEIADRLEQVQQTIREFEEQSKFQEADELVDKYGAVLIKTTPVRQALGNLREVVYGAHFDPDMTAAEKRQNIDDAMFIMTEIARDFNEQFRELEEESP